MNSLLRSLMKFVYNTCGMIGLVLLFLQNSLVASIERIMHTQLLVAKAWVVIGWWVITLLYPLYDPSFTSHAQLVWSSSTLSPSLTPPAGAHSAGWQCQELLFCKHPCTAWSCLSFCQAGQSMGESCVWANNSAGTCVGVCQSTIQTTLTSCIQQPLDPNNCAANDPCVGFLNNPLLTNPNPVNQCLGWCGSLSWATVSNIDPNSSNLCAGWYSYASGSLTQTSNGWVWKCISAFWIDALQWPWVACSAFSNGWTTNGWNNPLPVNDCDPMQAGNQAPGSLCSTLGVVNQANGMRRQTNTTCSCEPFTCSLDLPSTVGIGQTVSAQVSISSNYPGIGSVGYSTSHTPNYGSTPSWTVNLASFSIPITYTSIGSVLSRVSIAATSTLSGMVCSDQITILTVPPTASYTCTGLTPTHASLCPSDGSGLVVDLPKQLVTTCSSPVWSYPKCEYSCDAGYALSNWSCVALWSTSAWSTTSKSWGRPSSITPNNSSNGYCGDRKRVYPEECDDGNTTNADGCSSTCRIEKKFSDPNSPLARRFVDKLRTSLSDFKEACAYHDVEYGTISFADIQWNPDEEAIRTLQAYCIVKWYTVSLNKKYHSDSATSIGEAIKVLVKIYAMDEGVEFDEFGRHQWTMPYSDMLANAWYTPYVLYAHDRDLLDGLASWKLFGRGELKALTPISKKQFKQLLENFWVDPDAYAILDSSGKYLMRDDFASIVVDAFQHKLGDYQYLYGNNTVFYRRLLGRIEKQPVAQQEAYLRRMITGLRTRDPDGIGWKYNLHVEGMIEFLESLIH